jgi:hypothetical protein
MSYTIYVRNNSGKFEGEGLQDFIWYHFWTGGFSGFNYLEFRTDLLGVNEVMIGYI